MKRQAITVIEPQIRELTSGRLSRIYRPTGGLLELTRPGDLLSVREPFWLPTCYDHISPSQAAERGAVPNFVADFDAGGSDAAAARLNQARQAGKKSHG